MYESSSLSAAKVTIFSVLEKQFLYLSDFPEEFNKTTNNTIWQEK